MEIHNDISRENILRAHAELDSIYFTETAERAKNVVTNDGMTLKILQDGIFDSIVNRLDNRRVVLERKADIITQYYGNALKAKDLVKDYYAYKRVVSGAANLTCAGILLANVYTKFAKNSVLLGKVGTLVAIGGIQAANRYLTNNWLDSRVDRLWKIHLNRMSRGLGPTNNFLHYNEDRDTHSLESQEPRVTPSFDMLTHASADTIDNRVDRAYPMQKDHFPALLDSEHRELFQDTYVTPTRVHLTNPKDDKNCQPAEIIDVLEPIFGVRNADTGSKLSFNNSLWKEVINDVWTIWGPDLYHKKEVFEVAYPEQLRNDRVSIFNAFIHNPLKAPGNSEIPEYSKYMLELVNRTEDNFNIMKIHHDIRRLFIPYKREFADETFWRQETKPFDFDQTQFKKFVEKLEHDAKMKLINVIDTTPTEPVYNNLGSHSENLTNYLYGVLVQRQRPQMIKHQETENELDFDFDIDAENYDPWDEYRKIYRDALIKGRQYWIIKAIPEWVFLQVGKPKNQWFSPLSRYNPKRPNMEDSVFNEVTKGRYFDERERKANIHMGESGAIRI